MSAATKADRNRRRRFRYRPEQSTAAIIYLEDKGKRIPVTALIENESQSGCCLVFLSGPIIQLDQTYTVRIAEGLELKATPRWIIKVDDTLTRVGFEFFD